MTHIGIYLWIAGIIVFIFLLGIRIVRPTHRGLVERLGRYNRFGMPGLNWVIPVIETMRQINITEMMVDAAPQEIITNDNLNARVDAQVYFRVKEDEPSVKASQYNVNNFQWQIVNLARTTLRNIIGTLTLKSANSERGKINDELHKILVGGSSVGFFVSRRRSAEVRSIDSPEFLFNRDTEGNLELIGYTMRMPGGSVAYRLKSEGVTWPIAVRPRLAAVAAAPVAAIVAATGTR